MAVKSGMQIFAQVVAVGNGTVIDYVTILLVRIVSL